MSKKSAKEIFLNGKGSEFTADHIVEVVEALYANHLAEIWFIGMGWPEGYAYCANHGYLEEWAKGVINREEPDGWPHWRACWFACAFL